MTSNKEGRRYLLCELFPLSLSYKGQCSENTPACERIFAHNLEILFCLDESKNELFNKNTLRKHQLKYQEIFKCPYIPLPPNDREKLLFSSLHEKLPPLLLVEKKIK